MLQPRVLCWRGGVHVRALAKERSACEAILGRRANSVQELVAAYGALLAHGTENDAKGVAAMKNGDVLLLENLRFHKGEKKGALVEAQYGKGRWVYVGLGLWRELPAGVDGAYQLLANLLSIKGN